MKPVSKRPKEKKLFCVTGICLSLLLLSGCGKGDGKFSSLVGGVSSVDELTLEQALPDVENVVVEQSQTQSFFISAMAPTGRQLSYQWDLSGSMVGNSATYSLTGNAGNIGNYTLTATITDSVVTKQKTWNVKVNGPPSVTAVTTGSPKVSVGSSVPITVSATDPNDDTLTYNWTLNGLPSAHLDGPGPTATLTGDASIVGPVNIQVTVSDGTASSSYSWVAEINHFPQKCNELKDGEICTYAGSPSLGDGTNPLSSAYDLKISPIAHAQDALGNFFIADWGNNIIWYWNRTNAPVKRLSVTVPAKTIAVVAGTGEAASGPDGLALETGINGPRGLYFHEDTQRLYVSEWNANRVRYIDSSGFIFTGIGGASSQVNGDPAFNHACGNPAGLTYDPANDSLYVACRNSHRVKRWDLSTDKAYTVLGTGGNSFGTMPGNPTAVAANQPYDVYFVPGQGLYVAHMEPHRITFLNMSGATKTFWSATTAYNINDGQVGLIIGTGSSGADNNVTPTAGKINRPGAILVQGDIIYFALNGSSNDTVYAANNSASDVVIGGSTVTAGTMKKITAASAGYNGTGVNLISGQLNDPYDLSVDVFDSSIIHFSDLTNRRMRYIHLTDEKMYNMIGSGKSRNGFYGDVAKPSIEHLFSFITGLVFDTVSRELFFTDSANCRVRKVSPYGIIETAVGRGCAAPTVDNDVPSNSFLNTTLTLNDNDISGLSLLPDRSLVIGNSLAHNFRLWNRTSSDTTYFNSYIQADRISNLAGDYLAQGNADGPALEAQLNRPADSVYDPSDGHLILVDLKNHCLRKLSPDGDVTAYLGTCGTSGNSGSDVAPGSLVLNTPSSVAIDSKGNLIIADRLNHKVRYYNRGSSQVTMGPVTIDAGKVVTIACLNGASGSNTEDILAQSAACNRPTGVAVNEKYICFSNQISHNVRCIYLTGSKAGRITTVAGFPMSSPRAGSPYNFDQEGVPATTVTLYNPSALAFDDNGDLYIADTYNHIVRKVKMP